MSILFLIIKLAIYGEVSWAYELKQAVQLLKKCRRRSQNFCEKNIMSQKLFIYLFIALLSACERNVAQSEVDELNRDQLSRLRNEINSLFDETGNISSCRAVAFGSKPCGGPWEYLVYSNSATETEIFLNKVANYNKLEKDLNIQENAMSDCAHIQEPKLTVIDGKCVALSEHRKMELPRGNLNLLSLTEMHSASLNVSPLRLIDANVVGDTLAIQISYSGGCRTHEFELLDTGIATKSIPPQHLLRLVHVLSDDPCEALVTKMLFYDLLPLKNKYDNLGSVALRIEGLGGMPLYSWK